MSGKGNAYDNAKVASFFKTLTSEEVPGTIGNSSDLFFRAKNNQGEMNRRSEYIRGLSGSGSSTQKSAFWAIVLLLYTGILTFAVESNSNLLLTVRVVTVVLVDSAGTSNPSETFPGDPGLVLQIGLNNLSSIGVTLETTSSILFSDSVSTYQAVLANQTYIPGNANNFTVTFSSAAVPAAITAPASYDFTLFLEGTDDITAAYADTIVTTGRCSIFMRSVQVGFTNYPNPFAAGREVTTITYDLEQKSWVTIKLYTLWGAPVKTLLEDKLLDPGPYQDVKWDGKNGHGNTVNNGVYYLVLKIRGVDGKRTTSRRKVGVLR